MKIVLECMEHIKEISYYNHNYYLLDGCHYKWYTTMYVEHNGMYGLTSIQFGSIINGKFEAEYFCYGYEEDDYIIIEGEE